MAVVVVHSICSELGITLQACNEYYATVIAFNICQKFEIKKILYCNRISTAIGIDAYMFDECSANVQHVLCADSRNASIELMSKS